MERIVAHEHGRMHASVLGSCCLIYKHLTLPTKELESTLEDYTFYKASNETKKNIKIDTLTTATL